MSSVGSRVYETKTIGYRKQQEEEEAQEDPKSCEGLVLPYLTLSCKVSVELAKDCTNEWPDCSISHESTEGIAATECMNLYS